MQGGKIRRKRTLVVSRVAAGGLGNGDVYRHGSNSVMTDAANAIGVQVLLRN
jgi:hypothetical protein